jgi:hypothetical protein
MFENTRQALGCAGRRLRESYHAETSKPWLGNEPLSILDRAFK